MSGSDHEAHFFVHPDYHQAYFRCSAGLETYEAAIDELIDAANNPILIYNPVEGASAGKFWKRFPSESKFPSLEGSGLLSRDPAVHRDFNGLLLDRRITHGVVSGSYLEACVATFRANLEHYSTTGILRFRSPEKMQEVDQFIGSQAVKYGVVLCCFDDFGASIPDLVHFESAPSPDDFSSRAQIFKC